MKQVVMMLVAIVISLTTATAEVFDIPPTGAWTKVQEGDVTQWVASPPGQPWVRIDLVSHVEDDGKRVTYYLIREACPSNPKRVAWAVVAPGHRLGVGRDCKGREVVKYATVLKQLQELPPEAAALLK